jgi:hypothetical protein
MRWNPLEDLGSTLKTLMAKGRHLAYLGSLVKTDLALKLLGLAPLMQVACFTH